MWLGSHHTTRTMFFFGKEVNDFDKLVKQRTDKNGGIVEYLTGLTARMKETFATNAVPEATRLHIYKRFLDVAQWDIQACSKSQPNATVPTERTVLTLLKDLNHNLQTDASKARSDLESFSKKALIDLLMRDHRAVVEAIRAQIPSTSPTAMNAASTRNFPPLEDRTHANAPDVTRTSGPDIANKTVCTPVTIVPRWQGGVHAHHLDTIRDYITPELAAKNQKIVDANPSKNKSKKQPRKRDQFRKDDKVRNPFYTASSACVVCLFTKRDAHNKPLKSYTFRY